jgi:hypothetical protein
MRTTGTPLLPLRGALSAESAGRQRTATRTRLSPHRAALLPLELGEPGSELLAEALGLPKLLEACDRVACHAAAATTPDEDEDDDEDDEDDDEDDDDDDPAATGWTLGAGRL